MFRSGKLQSICGHGLQFELLLIAVVHQTTQSYTLGRKLFYSSKHFVVFWSIRRQEKTILRFPNLSQMHEYF